ncbi:uncharacterized protein LOC124813237 isoform X3 [Hydra vulgaris]|uniref:uncharacterized protein LOC124813237 isoform X3 n=1 Tax=Hydra vulgaris TaxID=6087 RepID=UPI0032EA19B4
MVFLLMLLFKYLPSPLLQKTNSSSCSLNSSRHHEKSSQLREATVTKNDTTLSVLKEILRCQQEMKIVQENHTAILNSLLRHNSINYQASQLPEDVTLLLPLKCLKAAEEFEDKLKDPDIFKTVVLWLSDQGGRSLVEATGRMMAKLMTNELAQSCNLCGRNGKKGLKGSLLFLILTSWLLT